MGSFMRTGRLVPAVAVVFCAVALGQSIQIAPVPPNPLELVTGETQVPASPEQRAAIVSLLDRTVENHNLHLRGGPPFTLNLSLNVAASTLYPAASGTMQESWVTGDHWRWSASLGSYSQIQLSSNGAVYNQNPATLPIRLREIRGAVFAPVLAAPRRATIRTATVAYKGTQITCIMLSAGGNAQKAAQGRQWYETEYCIDPASATLQIFSEAPGIYIAYDYANGLKFHNRLLPGKISVSENGDVVADAQLTSMVDADPSNLSIFTPTAEMVARGAAPVMGSPERFPIFVFSDKVPSGPTIQPTIVHVTLDAAGQVQEIEALQSGALTDQAIALIRNRKYAPIPQPAGSSALLRDAYVNVQFRHGPVDSGPLIQ
jgi:hypothetical protein